MPDDKRRRMVGEFGGATGTTSPVKVSYGLLFTVNKVDSAPTAVGRSKLKRTHRTQMVFVCPTSTREIQHEVG